MLVFKLKGQIAAKVTSVTAMVISAAMVIYAVLVMILNGGGGILLGLAGAYIFYTSYELFRSAQRNDLGSHPIFGRECYKGNGGSAAGGSGGGTGTAAPTMPVQADDAVMA